MTHYNLSANTTEVVEYPGNGYFRPNITQLQLSGVNSRICHSDNGFGRENHLDFSKTRIRGAKIGYSYSRKLNEYDENGKLICTACKTDGRYGFTIIMPDAARNTDSYDAGIEYDARRRILGKLTEGELSVGTTLGEGPETFSYIKDKVTALNKTLSDMKDRYKRLQMLKKIPMWKPFHTLKLAGVWLEYRFAIAPLIGEINTYWDVATRNSSGDHGSEKNAIMKNLGFAIRAHSEKTIELNWLNKFKYDVLGYDKASAQTTTRRITYITKGYISDPEVWALRQVGLYNPAEIIWDLTPLSFFVDYFVPIGNTIAAASATNGYTFSQSSKTVTIVNRVETNVIGTKGYLYEGSTGSGSALRVEVQKTRRLISSSVFSSRFTDLINGAKINLNLEQVLDTLALTRTIIFGRK